MEIGLSALSARSDEMFGALLDSQKTTLEAMQAQTSAMSGKPAQALGSLSKDAIWANERGRVAMLCLQGILKSAPLGKPAESPTLVIPINSGSKALYRGHSLSHY